MPHRRQRGSNVACSAVGAETLHHGLIPLVAADEFADPDLASRLRQHHAAARSADRANETYFGQIPDNLVKMVP